MQLTGPELKELREALLKAFPDVADFDQMMKDRLDRRVSDYTPPKKTPLMIAAVLEGENAAETLPELVRAALAERPNSSVLRAVAEDLGLATRGLAGRQLQKLVEEKHPFADFHTWLEHAAAIENRVCRIVFEGEEIEALGTGFLIGPSVVMTNWHVVDGIDPTRIRAQFDHYVLRDKSIAPGTLVPLAAKWLIDSASPSKLDEYEHPIDDEPAEEELDYALLRLARPAGNEPFGPAKNPDAALQPRGWIDLKNDAPPALDDLLFIVQHPSGDPMQIAWNPHAVIGFSPRRRRIRYRTNTLPGSSGAPVLDIFWRLVALHHSGDPRKVQPAAYNEGIPIPAIVRRLEKRGVMGELAG